MKFKLDSWRASGAIVLLIGCIEFVFLPAFGDQFRSLGQASVVQRVDNAIHRINHYSVDSVVCFIDTYPLDIGLSGE